MQNIQTALAIEQYRIQRGTFPDKLDDLVPKFLTALPLDPFDGQQLRYNHTDEGYLLYSIGPDRLNDKGQKALPFHTKNTNPLGDIILLIHR